VSAAHATTALTRVTPPAVWKGARSRRLVERNLLVYRHAWLLLVSGLFEPIFYLLSIGVGIGHLVGKVPGPGGHPLDYRTFVAPALLASASMNGAIYDSTMNVFYKLKYAKTYDAILSTPLGVDDVARGEITWALIRGFLYAIAFIVVMLCFGLVHSWWMLLALPCTVLIGFGFAAIGMAATSFMRNWQDFEFVQLSILPLFLLSTTFYPLATYPRWLQLVTECTPLFHGVVLLRALNAGVVDGSLLLHAAYFVVMGAVGVTVSGRRLGHLLLK
jgi:lipooligosaccharide transport system permease protein